MILNKLYAYSFFLFGLISSSCFATDNLIVKLVGIENYAPYSFMYNNKPQGLYTDIAKELFKRAGYKVEIELVPFKRLLSFTQSGRVTGMVGTFFSPQRNKFAKYLQTPLTNIRSGLFVQKLDPLNIFSYQALKDKKIARKRGFITAEAFETHIKNGLFAVHEVETVNEMIQMLLKNRVDAFTFDIFSTNYYAHKLSVKNQLKELLPHMTSDRYSFIALSRIAIKQYPSDFFFNTNLILKNMLDDGSIEKIKKSYVSNHL